MKMESMSTTTSTADGDSAVKCPSIVAGEATTTSTRTSTTRTLKAATCAHQPALEVGTRTTRKTTAAAAAATTTTTPPLPSSKQPARNVVVITDTKDEDAEYAVLRAWMDESGSTLFKYLTNVVNSTIS